MQQDRGRISVVIAFFSCVTYLSGIIIRVKIGSYAGKGKGNGDG